jgi:hypothetical protein
MATVSEQWREWQDRFARIKAVEKVESAVKRFDEKEQNRLDFYMLHKETGTVAPCGMTPHQEALHELLAEVSNGEPGIHH